MILGVAANETDNSTHDKWVQWLRFVSFPKMVQWCSEKLPTPSIRCYYYKSFNFIKNQEAKKLELLSWHDCPS